MKKIVEYRKLLNVDKTVDLKELKTIYRNAMKDAHPDKFQGDEEGLKAAEENSKKIIEAYHFLVSINPCWSKNVWQSMFYDHLKMTENEAVQLLKGQYEQSIVQYDEIQKEALKMADYMTEGTIRQTRK